MNTSLTSRLLDFKDNPVQELSLNELKETVDERNIGGNPIGGVVHFVLLERIYDMITKSGLEFKMGPIYATSGGASSFPGVTKIKPLEEKYGDGALQAHILRRLITSFELFRGEDEDTTQSIAVAYHQRGIQIAFGPNIKVCQNQCIMGAGNRFQTFGDDKLVVEEILTKIYYWLGNYDDIRGHDVAILNRMKEIVLTYDNMCDLLGELTMYRIGRDELRIHSEYMLQQNQINDIAIQYLKFLIKDDNKINYNHTITLYKFYNMCTELYKPEFTDLPNIIGRNNLLGDYLIGKFILRDNMVEVVESDIVV